MLRALATATLAASVVLSALLGSATTVQAQDRDRRARATELSALGVRFAEAGDRVSARAYLRDAITADPSFTDAYVALGELELSRDAWRDAEATFRVGLVRAQPDARLWIGLARALDGMGAANDADSVLAQADAQLRDDPELLAFRAEHAEARGRWSLALAITRRSATLAEARGDRERVIALRSRERALSVLVGSLDPVRHPPAGAPALRELLAGPRVVSRP